MEKKEGRPQSYVGVSGVVMQRSRQSSGAEVRIPQQIFLESYADSFGLFDTGRLLALGAKATHKTQFQDKENKYGSDWYPVGERDFAEALGAKEKHPRTFGIAKAHLEVSVLENSAYRDEFMQRVVRRGKAWLQAVQFDMLPWHNRGQMLDFTEKVKDDNPELKILLQCHDVAMEELGQTRAIRRLGAFAPYIDYILFDIPYGTGKQMDVARLDGLLEEAYASDALATVGMAVAGGLNAERVTGNLPHLLQKYPDLSWDAESQLHPLNNVAKRPLQMDIVKEYLRASTEVLQVQQN